MKCASGKTAPDADTGPTGEIELFLEWGGIAFTPAGPLSKGGTKYGLETCPFNPDHVPAGSNPAVLVQPDGAFGFHCFDTSCADNGWKEFRALVEERKGAKFQFSGGKFPMHENTQGGKPSPWSLAVGMGDFLDDQEEAVDFLVAPVIVKEAVTEIFSPRGLGKSLWALFAAVSLAQAGRKVLLIDRDNPSRVVRDRLRSFGATRDLATLKILSRENAPPLTNARAWAEFPYFDYDLVIVDSIDSAAEGIGEQDSTKPSLAIAPLLDIARRENGPAVLLLGNTIKSAKHSRGSGVIEDRADIVFEVRDATNFHPTGKKSWIEELPAADAGSWAGRSTRRKRLSKYRLAFIATKFRIGEEPEPFIVEIDLTAEPWTVRDVTDDVDREGAATRARAAEERATAVQTATESLRTEILRREAVGGPVLLKKQAEDFLTSRNLSQKMAREVIKSPAFETVKLPGKGHPKGVRLAGKNDTGNRNGTPTEPAPDEGFSYGDFGCPHPERPTEMPRNETRYPCGFQGTPISVGPTLSTPQAAPETGANDDEVTV